MGYPAVVTTALTMVVHLATRENAAKENVSASVRKPLHFLTSIASLMLVLTDAVRDVKNDVKKDARRGVRRDAKTGGMTGVTTDEVAVIPVAASHKVS